MNKKKLFAALALGTLLVAPQCAFAASKTEVGMPNPIVEYKTYAEAVRVADVHPLYLTPDSGYACYSISVISGHLADLRFRRIDAPETTVQVRTAEIDKSNSLGEDISGVYGAKWERKTIAGVSVSIAKTSGKDESESYAAHWRVDDHLFSAYAQNITRADFLRLLTNSLVDASAHYYIDD